MEAQELRIGNYVWYGDSELKIDINVLYDIEVYKSLGTKPIMLTEEWLFKFHSKEEIDKNMRFPNEITIYDRFIFIWKENYKYWYVVTSYHKEYLTKIEFVHEYQNFIFALTGEELIIKN